MPRFSANLHFLFPEHAFLDRFAAAARCGFRAVEFPDPYSYPLPEIAARLAEHRLECVLLNLPMGDRSKGDMGIACLPDRVDEFREGVARAIAAARALGCPRLNCIAGKQLPGSDPELLRATLVANLRYAAHALAQAGLALDLEPINTVDSPGYFVGTSAQAVEIIQAVGAPNLQLQFDFYHLQIMEGGVAESVQRLLPLIGHIQIADVPGRHEPGAGTMPYAEHFALLDRIGYQGWVGAEYKPSKRTEETFGWMPPQTAA